MARPAAEILSPVVPGASAASRVTDPPISPLATAMAAQLRSRLKPSDAAKMSKWPFFMVPGAGVSLECFLQRACQDSLDDRDGLLGTRGDVYCCMGQALAYIDTLITEEGVPCTDLTIYYLTASSLLVATKHILREGFHLKLTEWASTLGLELAKIAQCEMELFTLLKWKTHRGPEKLDPYLTALGEPSTPLHARGETATPLRFTPAPYLPEELDDENYTWDDVLKRYAEEEEAEQRAKVEAAARAMAASPPMLPKERLPPGEPLTRPRAVMAPPSAIAPVAGAPAITQLFTRHLGGRDPATHRALPPGTAAASPPFSITPTAGAPVVRQLFTRHRGWTAHGAAAGAAAVQPRFAIIPTAGVISQRGEPAVAPVVKSTEPPPSAAASAVPSGLENAAASVGGRQQLGIADGLSGTKRLRAVTPSQANMGLWPQRKVRSIEQSASTVAKAAPGAAAGAAVMPGQGVAAPISDDDPVILSLLCDETLD